MKLFTILVLIFSINCSCNNKSSMYENGVTSNTDSLKKIIKDINPTPIEEFQDNCYHNSIYSFRICFPLKWIFKKMTDPIVIFNTQSDSAKGFIIMKMPDKISSLFSHNDIERMSRDDILDIEKMSIEQLNEINYKVKYIKSEKSILGGVPTLFTFSRVIGKLGEIENVEMVIVKHFIITPTEKTIVLQYSAPAIFFNKQEEERYTSVFNSFQFDK